MPSDRVLLASCGQKLEASREALRQCSRYFDAMFASGMKESSCDEIEMRDIEPDTLRALIDVSEGRSVKVSNDNVDSLLKAGCLFQFEELRRDCTDHLLRTVCLDNAVETWQKGDVFGVRQLCRAALVTLLSEFEKFVEHASLTSCPRPLLERLLSNDTLNVSNEGVVRAAAEKWLRVNGASCTVEEVIAVASRVRRGQLHEQASAAWCSFVEALLVERDSAVDQWREAMQSSVTMPPRSIMRPAVAVSVLGGSCRDLSNVCVYMPKKSDEGPFTFHSELPLAGRPEILRGFVVCSVGKDAYFLCGEYGIGSGHWNLNVFRWDHMLSKWVEVATLPEPRRHCKPVVVGNLIHLYGGFGRYRVRLFSVDIYDTSTGLWHRGETLQEDVAIDASAIVNLNDHVCIIPTCPAGSDEAVRALPFPANVLTVSRFIAIPFSSHKTVIVSTGADSWYTFHEPRTFSEYTNPRISLQSLMCGCAVGDGVGFFMENQKSAVLYNFDTDEQHRLYTGFGKHVLVESCFGMPYFDVTEPDLLQPR
ncbi:kelch-like protein 10 [Dermacentor albipictus]|uniref:kelch-like protein 10 n=1 Tax=Dermacentor albipictus TaxID=60249 RepID=UPI0038FC14C6